MITTNETKSVDITNNLKKQRQAEISQRMIDSGIFKVTTLTSINYYIDKVKADPAAVGMTDAQIVAALSDPQSPHYNPDFVHISDYYAELMSV